MICVFSFLPETPIQDQTIYIIKAYHAATRVVTLFSTLADQRRIIEYPIYIRQPVSLAAFILFRLHLSPLLLPQYVESSRQSVVTVHRLFRNMLTAWKDVENDISRTAKVLEKLNFVIISHPELFTKAPGIITRMRSHLTASLFYELIWAIHEARRRGGIGSSSTHAAAFVAAAAAAAANNSNGSGQNGNNSTGIPSHLQPNSINSVPGSHVDSVLPLPFFNQITKDDFTATTSTTPNGTTITTLVPTLKSNAAQSVAKPLVSNINGATVNTTPLAGIGNPSTMLAAGPDVAGSLLPALKKFSPSSRNAEEKTDQAESRGRQPLPPPLHKPQPGFINASNNSGMPSSLNSSSGLRNAIATGNVPSSNMSSNLAVNTPPGTDAPFGMNNSLNTTPRGTQSIAPFYDTTGSSTDPLHLDTLMQGFDWMDAKGDDLLGWMDNIDFNA